MNAVGVFVLVITAIAFGVYAGMTIGYNRGWSAGWNDHAKLYPVSKP